jgi:8-amino-7-oxononanoate synthase
MDPFPDILERRLKKTDLLFCRRSLSPEQGLDFSSNDYLGFARDQAFKDFAFHGVSELSMGSSAARLLRGNPPLFEEAEKNLARFSGREAALIFSSGYQANLGLFSGLLTSEDTVYSDELNHASIIDGIRLSGAKKKIFPHLNLTALRALLESDQDQGGLKVIVVESVFSMDGDQAPLLELTKLAEEYAVLLIVDEAHATGLWGDFSQNLGGGLVQSLGLSHRVFATVHPAGKALGLAGAWVAGDTQLKEYLINFSRPFIFSTAPLPLVANFLNKSVQYWKKVGMERSSAVFQNVKFFQERCHQGVSSKNSKDVLIQNRQSGPIIPLLIGKSALAMEASLFLQRAGFDIRAVRPPTVAEGKARLRITFHWNQNRLDIEELVLALTQLQGV